MGKFISWIAAQLADGLEKSTVGAISMFIIITCIVYLVVVEGGTATVDSLLTTAMIVAATLMGVNSVTEIFKKTDNRTLNINETISTNTTTSNTSTNNNTNTSTSTTTKTIHEDINVVDDNDSKNGNCNNSNNNNNNNDGGGGGGNTRFR